MKNEITRAAKNFLIGVIGSNIDMLDGVGQVMDNIGHPEAYVDNAGISKLLKTPLGDNWLQLIAPDNSFVAIEAPNINVSRKKYVNSTHILGLDTSITEISGIDDYNVTISAYFVSKWVWERVNTEEFKRFLSVVNSNGIVQVINAYLNENYGINKLIISSFSVNMTQYNNVVDIKITAKNFSETKIFGRL